MEPGGRAARGENRSAAGGTGSLLTATHHPDDMEAISGDDRIGDDGDEDKDKTSTPGAASNELDSSAFEGNSSLTAHTVFASKFLKHTVEHTSLHNLNPSMAAKLTSLKQIVGLS